MTDTVSFQRERNPHGMGAITGANSQLFAATRKGADKHVVWARDGVGAGTVGDYRADGYKLVEPKDVEIMERGQYTPADKDFGVYIDFDKKADRVKTLGGMTLMYCAGGLLRELQKEQKELGDMYRRKEVKPVDNRTVEKLGSDLGTEVTTTTESLASM